MRSLLDTLGPEAQTIEDWGMSSSTDQQRTHAGHGCSLSEIIVLRVGRTSGCSLWLGTIACIVYSFSSHCLTSTKSSTHTHHLSDKVCQFVQAAFPQLSSLLSVELTCEKWSSTHVS